MRWKKTVYVILGGDVMRRNVSWMIIFFRDLFLALVIFMIHYLTKFSVPVVWMLTGMLVVWITWHYQEFMDWRRWHSRTY